MHKHIFFLLAAMLLFTNTSQAQFKIGVKAGTLVSNVLDGGIGLTSGSNTDTKLSYLAGVVFAYPIYNRGHLQAELLYSKEGYRADETGSEVIRSHLHYLSLPILLQHEVANGLSVGGGPEISYLLAAYPRTEQFGIRSLDWYRPFELGINLNVQYQLLEFLTIGVRYNMGLSDITERVEVPIEGGIVAVDSDAYNRSLQLSLLYWLR